MGRWVGSHHCSAVRQIAEARDHPGPHIANWKLHGARAHSPFIRTHANTHTPHKLIDIAQLQFATNQISFRLFRASPLRSLVHHACVPTRALASAILTTRRAVSLEVPKNVDQFLPLSICRAHNYRRQLSALCRPIRNNGAHWVVQYVTTGPIGSSNT